MIPQVAIDAFLNRPVDDHRGLKSQTVEQMDALLAERYPTFKPYPALRLHQRVCSYLGLRYPRFAFYCDMGTGKTLVTLELLRYWWEQGSLRKALVFVISDMAYNTWEKQIKLYDIGIPFVALEGSSEQKWHDLKWFKEGLVLVHYPGAIAMVSAKISAGNGKGKLVLDDNLVDKLMDKVDAVVLDESTRAGHISSLTNALCRQITDRVDICYALAGRPFGRDPQLLWGQQYLIDQGASLGETLGLFREAFFTATRNRWARGSRAKYVMDFHFKKKMMPQLTRLAQHRSITYRADECIDLPELVAAVEEVRLPEEARIYYRRVVEQIIAAKGNVREMKNAFVRMRQLSSGFLGFRDDDTEERVEVAFEMNPKLDRLMELIEDVPEECSAVIFYEFTWSGRRIVNTLKEKGLDCIWLWSGTKNARADLNLFEAGRVPFAVVNWRVGAYSLDELKTANYLCFYESPVSVIDREQAERRLRRQGQEKTVFQYDLVVRGTLDQRILDYHREGQALFDVLTKKPEEILAGLE